MEVLIVKILQAHRLFKNKHKWGYNQHISEDYYWRYAHGIYLND